MEAGGQPQSEQAPTHKKPSWWLMGLIVVLAAIFAVGLWWLTDLMVQQSVQQTNESVPTKSKDAPELTTTAVFKDRTHIWDIAFLPTKQMVFTERAGTITLVENDQPLRLATLSDVKNLGEGGLMGLAVDNNFAENHYLYVCLNSTKGDIRVARLQVTDDLSAVTNRTDIVTGISANSGGRHAGCRVAMGPDGYVWIGTGDSAVAGVSPQRPQDPKSLNGKVLRVDRDGKAAPGNLGGAFDARIYNYGHRNIQGLAFYPSARDGVLGVTVEHGSTVDDEINPLKLGNFGWDPDVAYTERDIPMTDKTKFPTAIDAIWSSGNPTQAPSGAAFIRGAQWKAWAGSLAVVFLKDQKLKIVDISATNTLVSEDDVLEKQFGRLRAVAMGPDGSLYIGTSNGGGKDQIIRVTPR